MNLYKLADNYQNVMQMLEDEEMDFDVAIDTIDCIESAIEVKATNIVYIAKNLEVYANGLDNEIKRLQAKQKAVASKQESIKNYLFTQLEHAGLSELKTNIATIKMVNNPPSVAIHNENFIPAKYLTVIPESYKVSKTEIAKDLKAGVEVPGATLQKTKRWVIK